MTIENATDGQLDENNNGDNGEPTTPTEQPNPPTNVNDDTGEITVDMYGVPIKLPLETAKQLIEKRDQRSSAFKDLSDKVKEYETKVQDTTRKLQAAEAAKNGQLSEAEALFNQKLTDTVSKYKSKVIKGEIVDALTRNEKFLDSDSTRNDAIALIMSQHDFALADDDTIKVGDKNVKDIVNEFIDSREAFQRVNKTNPKRQQTTHITTKEKPDLKQAMGSYLKDKFGMP